jgi:hypothetical protein
MKDGEVALCRSMNRTEAYGVPPVDAREAPELKKQFRFVRARMR